MWSDCLHCCRKLCSKLDFQLSLMEQQCHILYEGSGANQKNIKYNISPSFSITILIEQDMQEAGQLLQAKMHEYGQSYILKLTGHSKHVMYSNEELGGCLDRRSSLGLPLKLPISPRVLPFWYDESTTDITDMIPSSTLSSHLQ